MIAYLEGRLAKSWHSSLLVITDGGVGYEVAVPIHTAQRLTEKNSRIALYTSLSVREDALELFGFESWEERQTFVLLTGISKVGARTALSILGTFRPADLSRIVMEQDVNALTRVSGIGKKNAQHIFLELSYKLKVEPDSMAEGLSVGTPGMLMSDALDGLKGLGYKESEAVPVLRELIREDPTQDVTELLRSALKKMSKGK